MATNLDVRVALTYHESTKHTVERLRAGHGLDWGNQPIPFKLYRDLEPIPLPPPDSVTSGLDLAAIARLLHYSAGITRRRRYGERTIYFRAAAATGALYHIDLYLICQDLDGLPAGVYHYGPHDHSLRRLQAGDHRATLILASGGEAQASAAPALLVSASTYWRNSWKYRERAYRHVFWDAGTIHANLLEVASSGGIPAHVVLGFADGDVERLLGLDPKTEGAVTLVALGETAAAPPTSPMERRLKLAVEPLSRRPIDYPLIRETHAASSLDSGEAATRWRGAVPRTVEAATDLAWLDEPIEAVVRRRGSTRAFDPARSLTTAELMTALDVATQPLSSDFLGTTSSLVDIYVIVHAVDGLAPGVYFLRDGGLEGLRKGAFRTEAAHLALMQDLAGDAAANVYCMADLERVVGEFGNRGYRAAQLEGGVIGGRLYLAAYGQRFGATGLTFLDDEVTEFLSPHAAGKSVMFLTALGRSRRRR